MINPSSFGNPLFELDGWAFYADLDVDTQEGSMTYAIHLSCSTSKNKNFFMNTDNVSWMPDPTSLLHPVCRTCKDPIPDEMQAIMQLYKWNCK